MRIDLEHVFDDSGCLGQNRGGAPPAGSGRKRDTAGRDDGQAEALGLALVGRLACQRGDDGEEKNNR
jgi:hypothetical protein